MALENYFANAKPVLPVTVARTDQQGFPTKELVDWEQYTLDFYDKTITSLDTRTDAVQSQTDDNSASIDAEIIARTDGDNALASAIVTVQANVDTVSASVVTEATARVNGDNALAASITTVEVKADGATASGQVYLIAEAAPAGFSAQYGWTLTAGNESIGMKALKATGTGDGYIAFFADQFALIDPSYLGGGPVAVFNYNGTTFNFDVPVTIRNQEIGANAVTNSAVATGMLSDVNPIATSLTVRDGARVLINIQIYPNTAGGTTLTGPANIIGLGARTYSATIDGAGIANFYAMDTLVAADSNVSPILDDYTSCPSAAGYTDVVTGLAANTYSFGVATASTNPVQASITVTELADS
jgi:hypothetical protein